MKNYSFAKLMADIRKVVDYNWNDERADFQAHQGDGGQHIFKALVRLDNFLTDLNLKSEEPRSKVCYVAGKYRDTSESGVVRNIRSAEAVAVKLWQMGFAAITPHLNTALMGGLCPDEVWLKGDIEILKRCDMVVLVPNWRDSAGTLAEIAAARAHGIPVFEWPDDRMQLEYMAASPQKGQTNGSESEIEAGAGSRTREEDG